MMNSNIDVVDEKLVHCWIRVQIYEIKAVLFHFDTTTRQGDADISELSLTFLKRFFF